MQLQQLAQSVEQAESLEDMARPLLKLIQQVSGLDSTYLTEIREEQGVQQLRFVNNEAAKTDPDAINLEEGLIVPWSDTLCKRALDSGQMLTTNVPEVWGDSEAARELGIQTYVTVPVYAPDGEIYGTLCGASGQAINVNEESFALLRLCAQFITQQMARDAQAEQIRKRVRKAESQVERLQVLTAISKFSLAATELAPAIMFSGERLGDLGLSCAVLPFVTDDIEATPLALADQQIKDQLQEQLLNHQTKLGAMIDNVTTPLLWSSDQSSVIVVVTSDNAVEGGILLSADKPLQLGRETISMLESVANSLSLLAARLDEHAQLEAANDLLRHHASHDVLTGLPNRRYLINELPRLMASAEREGMQLLVGFIDLDGFKQINDTYGHDAGDEFLEQFAERLNGVARGSDIIARFGGDEFVLAGLVEKFDEEVRQGLIERWREVCSGNYALGSTTIDYQGPSVGVVNWLPGDSRDIDALLVNADEAMYKDKQARKQLATKSL